MLAALLCAVSCADNADSTQDGSATAAMRIKFTIAMGGQQASRAGTWGDTDYSPTAASEWENAIEADKLQVLAYSAAGKYLGKVSSLAYYHHTDDNGNVSSSIYDIIGSLDVPLSSVSSGGKLECKLMIFANYEQEIPSQLSNAVITDMAGDNDANIKYRYDASGISARTAYIPMWGVKSYTGRGALVLKKGERTDAGEIFALRAMSKIRVSIDEETAKSYTLTGAELTDYNIRGYIVPAGYADADDTRSLSYSAGGAEPLSYNPAASKKNGTLQFTEEAAGKSYVAYIPEYETTTDDADGETTPRIVVTLADKDGNNVEPGCTIQLRRYTDGAAGDVLKLTRNTVYNYTITGAKSVRYQAVDWTTGLGGEIDMY